MKDDQFRSHFGDEEYQMMRQQLKVPHLLCPSGREVTNVCVNTSCRAKNALFCDHQQCLECHSPHSDCQLVRLKQLTTLIQNRTEEGRELIMTMLQKQNEVIEKIIQMRKILVQKYQWVSLPLNIQEVLDLMFKKREERVQMSSALAFEMLQTLKKGKDEGEQRGKEVIKQFEREIDKIGSQLTSIKETLLEGIYSEQTVLKSRIIKAKSSEQFLFKSLNSPAKLELLFRASDHDFSALKFHQFCDGVPHTLTIIATEFGKTIAGYTPLTWQSPSIDKFPYGRTVPDLSKRSFLLSIDLREKLTLRETDSAIFVHKDWGPYFGRGADLRIGNRCNKEANSYASVPISYAFEGEKYECNQQTWSGFCGAAKGSFFRVVEYQVFRVQW